MVDPDRVDNSVTNDGFTMRELRYAIGARAADEDDYYEDEPSPPPLPVAAPATAPASVAMTAASTAVTPAGTPPLIGPVPPTPLDSMTIQLSQDVKTVSKLVGDIAQLEAAIEEAADPSSDATKRDALLLERKRMRLARLKTNGNGLKPVNPRGTVRELSQRGPSQVVSYSSRFVKKLRYGFSSSS